MTFSQTLCRNTWVARRDTRVNKIKSSKSFLRERSRSNRTNFRELNEIYIEHFQINETKILLREVTKQQNESSWIEWNLHRASSDQRNESFFFGDDDCTLLSFNASWVSENDREFARMTVNCRFSFSSLRHLVNCRFFSSSFRHLVNSRSFCSSRSVDIQSIDDLFAFESVSSPTSLYNIYLFETLRHRLLKREIEITHTHNLTSNQQTIIQNQSQNFRFLDLLHSQHCRKVYSLRFASSVFQRVCSFNDIQWVRYND